MMFVRKLRTYGVISCGVGTAALLLFTRSFGPHVESTNFGYFIVAVGFLASIGGLVMMVGSVLRLPIALCVAQTAVTAILTFWADRMWWMYAFSPNRTVPRFARLHLAVVPFRQTWSSINAPTFPLNYAENDYAGLKGYRVLSVGEILYLIAVAVLWYLVGYFYERRKMRKRRVVAVAILIWGVILLCFCIVMVPDMVFNAGGFDSLGFLNTSPYGVWGLVLIRFGVKNLRSFSQTQQSVRS
jgi:hypothetical protein